MKDMNVDEWPAFHEKRMHEVDALAKRANKRHESDPPDGKRLKDLSQAERDSIEKDVTARVDEITNTPQKGREILFDHYLGWHEPEVKSDTYGSLKEVLATLKNIEGKGVVAPDDFYTAVERLLFKYSLFVQHGVRESFSTHKNVTWYLVEADERAYITYQDGIDHEWFKCCFADEVPLWLLIGLVRRIERRKPLGDQKADETIESLDKLEIAYKVEKERRENESNKDRQLNILKRSRFFDSGSDGE